MGSFSWLRADHSTARSNICYTEKFKFLIPQEFGGGFIKDSYQDYGYIGHKLDGTPKYDAYELQAFWNCDSKNLFDDLQWEGKEEGVPMPLMKEIDKYTDQNRSVGIDIGLYKDRILRLEYPLKFVSCSYEGSYEECDGVSFRDPEQGFYPTYW